MLGWCIVTLASARLKASVQFPSLKGMYQRGGTCKGCDSLRSGGLISLAQSIRLVPWRNRFIILATDYATKWVKARPTRKNDATIAAVFLFEEIMMRFGHPLEIESDRRMHFLNDVICDITTKYLINHRKTTPYNLKANGLTERANGIIGKVLNKLVAANKTDWDLKLPSAVHACNTLKKRTRGGIRTS